ncbi:MAG: hypothetical protein GY845_21565 [Planctomycetes bacterium]|nr:hypothetical protein [Planctomycetota bacterium]
MAVDRGITSAGGVRVGRNVAVGRGVRVNSTEGDRLWIVGEAISVCWIGDKHPARSSASITIKAD